jgi:hypothetical protein
MATISTNARPNGLGTTRSWDKKVWAGRVMSALPIGLMTLSSAIKLTHAPDFVAAWTQKLGWPEATLTSIGLLELACVALYAVPQTAVLGAVLLTGYLGGAIASHVRISDPFLVPLALGVLVWGGVYLRDERLRSLLPRRSAPAAS